VPSRRPRRRMTLSVVTVDAEGPATKLAASTVNRILAAVSSFYEYAILSGMWERANPIEKRPDPALARVPERHRPFMGRASRQRPVRRAVRVKTVQRVPRPLDDDQVVLLLEQLRGLRDRAIVLLMLHGGLRPGEVLGRHCQVVGCPVWCRVSETGMVSVALGSGSRGQADDLVPGGESGGHLVSVLDCGESVTSGSEVR
jgi:site-specific recombinase XerD